MVVSKALAARYEVLKQQQPDCLLLMQVGAFFRKHRLLYSGKPAFPNIL